MLPTVLTPKLVWEMLLMNFGPTDYQHRSLEGAVHVAKYTNVQLFVFTPQWKLSSVSWEKHIMRISTTTFFVMPPERSVDKHLCFYLHIHFKTHHVVFIFTQAYSQKCNFFCAVGFFLTCASLVMQWLSMHDCGKEQHDVVQNHGCSDNCFGENHIILKVSSTFVTIRMYRKCQLRLKETIVWLLVSLQCQSVGRSTTLVQCEISS